MSKIEIYDSKTLKAKVDYDGAVIYAESLTYTGTWMGECFLSVDVRNAHPIEWNIGDYIIYRDEMFVIDYDPSVVKKTKSGHSYDSFTYKDIKFNSRHNELTEIYFLDYVLEDSNIHWTSLPDFGFFASSIDDLCDRLQANTNRWCKENSLIGDDAWLFLTPNESKAHYRAKTAGISDVEFRKRWVEAYGEDDEYISTLEGKNDINLTVSQQTIWNSLEMIKSHFDLNFINRGRTVIIGSAGIPTSEVFSYGSGKGLYEFERVADNSQAVITKLFGYGSSTNLPIRYYANISLVCYAQIYNTYYEDRTLQAIAIPFKCFSSASGSPYAYTTIRTPDGTVILADVIDPRSLEKELADRLAASSSIIRPRVADKVEMGDEIVFLSGIRRDMWPLAFRKNEGPVLPNHMAVNRLMLPGFPEQSLADWVSSHGGTSTSWNGYEARFSEDPYNPYVLSVNSDTYGIKEGVKYFDGSNDETDIHPSMDDFDGENAIVSAELITDSGVFAEGDTEPTVQIRLPSLGDDFFLDQLVEDGKASGGTPAIVMESGFCTGREFQIQSVKEDSGTWVCICKREYDSVLDLWFPYSYAFTASTGTAYQLQAGDKFNLTGIPLPDSYIEKASENLLNATLEFLTKNQAPRFTYSPKIDEIYMARQNDEADADDTGKIRSLYKTIKEGDLLLFDDTDLKITDGQIFIDSLTIKENGNAFIPTYEVTLREDKTVSTIQKMQNQISSLSAGFYGSSVASGGGTNTGSGYTPNQIKNYIKAYGGEMFLSKLNDDTAAGVITFLKGLISKGDTIFTDILKSNEAIGGFEGGKGIVMDAIKGLIQTDGLEVRGFMRVMEMIINRLQLMESDYSFTEGDTVEHIDYEDGGQTLVLTMHKDHDNDFTPFYPGDIIYGSINDLLPKGEIPEGHSEATNGTYYKTWMRVKRVDLENNKLYVSLYQGCQSLGTPVVPGGLNFSPYGSLLYDDVLTPMTEEYNTIPEGSEQTLGETGFDTMLTITRHGNVADGLEDGDDPTSYSESVLESQKGRQHSWVLSTTDKRLSFFWKVNQPIIAEENYALALGILPDLSVLPDNRDKEMPSLYLNTVFAQQVVAINYPAKIIRVDRGSWGTNPSEEYTGNDSGTYDADFTLDELLSDSTYEAYWPHIRAIQSLDGKSFVTGSLVQEPYHNKTFTMNDWLTFRLSPAHKSLSDKDLYLSMKDKWHSDVDLEISRVWYNGILWECVSDCTTTEPEWDNSDWIIISGASLFALNFFTNDEDPLPLTVIQVYPDSVDFVTVPYLLMGDEDVSDMVTTWKWERSSFDEGGDEQWNAGYVTSQRTLHITNDDVPTGWGRGKKLEFICTASFSHDGMSEQLINRVKF